MCLLHYKLNLSRIIICDKISKKNSSEVTSSLLMLGLTLSFLFYKDPLAFDNALLFDDCKQSLKWLFNHLSIYLSTHPPTKLFWLFILINCQMQILSNNFLTTFSAFFKLFFNFFLLFPVSCNFFLIFFLRFFQTF